MIPPVGATCRYTFTTKFASLNGVYRTAAETSFKDAIASKVDFVATLYTPAGLSMDDFNADYAGYTNDRVMVLESVADNTVVYNVPESALSKIPDPTIRGYLPLVMVVQLGVFENTQVVLPVISEIEDLLQTTIGSTEAPYIISNETSKVYLTDSEYAVVEAARAANRSELVPLSVQLQAERLKVANLSTKLAHYEALLGSIAEANASGS